MAVPEILKLFSAFDIQATWATVGMLFAKDAEEWQQYMSAEIPTYDDPVHSPYQWFSSADYPKHCLFAPDLVAAISKSPGQEATTTPTNPDRPKASSELSSRQPRR